MSTDREDRLLADIISYVDDASSFLEGRSLAELAADRKSIAAIERCLQCVTEAAIRLGPDRLHAIAPEVRMQDLRGLGNRLRHAHDDLDLAIIHKTVIDDLPTLRSACSAALER